MKIVKENGLQSQSTGLPIANGHLNSIAYARGYVRRAMGDPRIEPPDLARANGTADLLTALYSAHRTGGMEGARTTWAAIKILNPTAIQLEAKDKLLHADELKTLSKPSYLIDGYPFYAFSFNVLYGPSGTGKSFFALDFSARLCLSGASVVYIAGEGLHGYASRWEVLKPHLDVPDGVPFLFWTEALQIRDPQAMEEFYQQLAERELKPDMVVIDTFARSAVGLDENSNKEVGEFIGVCDSIRSRLGCGLLIVHHTGKNGQMRGASALYGACDSALMVMREDNIIRLSNRFEDGGKNKFDQEQDATTWELLPKQHGEFSSAIVVPALAVTRNPIVTRRLTPNQRSILEVLDSAGEALTASGLVGFSEVPQSSMFRVLGELLEANYVSKDDKSKKYQITKEGRDAFCA